MSSPTVNPGFSDADPDPWVHVDANEIAPCGPIADGDNPEDVAFQEGWMIDDGADDNAILEDGVWTDSCEPRRATVLLGEGVGKAWAQAKVEMESFQATLLKLTGTKTPKFDEVFEIIFGVESPVCKLFVEEHIVKSHVEFKRFLATLFLSSAHQSSVKDMFNPRSKINTAGVMGEIEYGKIWKLIAKSNLSERAAKMRRLEPFWLMFERVINEQGKKLFIDPLPGNLVHQLTIDDDKVHIQTRKETAQLKIVRHVKDNVNGHTCHTMERHRLSLSWFSTPGSSQRSPTILFGR
jgi:hypothetical protein